MDKMAHRQFSPTLFRRAFVHGVAGRRAASLRHQQPRPHRAFNVRRQNRRSTARHHGVTGAPATAYDSLAFGARGMGGGRAPRRRTASRWGILANALGRSEDFSPSPLVCGSSAGIVPTWKDFILCMCRQVPCGQGAPPPQDTSPFALNTFALPFRVAPQHATACPFPNRDCTPCLATLTYAHYYLPLHTYSCIAQFCV